MPKGAGGEGFAAHPGGNRTDSGSFYNFGFMAYWWSATESDDGMAAWSHYLAFDNNRTLDYHYKKGYGFSVRCIRDVQS